MKPRPSIVLAGLALAGTCLLAPACGPSERGVVWSEDSMAALRVRAEDSGQAILVLLCPGKGEVGCGHLLEEARSPRAAVWAEGVLAVWLPAEDPEARRLIRLHHVGTLPALLLLSPEGHLLALRESVSDFYGLQPNPSTPMPLGEVAALRAREREEAIRAREAARMSPRDLEEALRLIELAVEKGNLDSAADLLSRLEPAQMDLRSLARAGAAADRAERPDLAVELWQSLLQRSEGLGLRAETMGRYARSLLASGQVDRFERFVFENEGPASQWEYLSVASGAAAAGRMDIASRVASTALERHPQGPYTESLRFYVEQS